MQGRDQAQSSHKRLLKGIETDRWMWKDIPADEGSLVMSSCHFPDRDTGPKRGWRCPKTELPVYMERGSVQPGLLPPWEHRHREAWPWSPGCPSLLRISSLYEPSFPTLSHLLGLVSSLSQGCQTLAAFSSNGSPRTGLMGQGVGAMRRGPVGGGGGEPCFGARSREPPTRTGQSWHLTAAGKP